MKDPKAIRKAIMTARNIAAMVDPNFARVPLPQIGEPDTEEMKPPLNFMGGGYAAGGEVYGDNSKIRVVGNYEGEHRLVPISPKNTNYRHVMEYVPIDWLMERRGNEYRHSPERMEQLRNEIQEEGLREPVLISTGKNSRTSIVGEGNHRVLAAKQLGYTHIPVRAMVGSSAGNDRFPEGAHDEDIIPEPNRYFPSDAKPSRVMRSLGYEGQEELPEDWWEKGYAAGGEVEQPTDYAAPDDMGLYSHAAVTAGGLQRTDTPDNYKEMLMKRGVKQSELDASGYDQAFADQPQVTREQVAAHFHENRTPIEEKMFYTENPNAESIAALEGEYNKKFHDWYMRKLAYREKNPDANLYDWGAEENDALQAELKQKRDALRQAGKNVDSAGLPRHEDYTLPGGENYREIMLKHGDKARFGGEPAHFGGEPNVLASLRMKDRTDSDGDKILHLDELQSDWGQQARKSGIYSPKEHQQYLRDLEQRAVPLVAEEFGIPEETARNKMPEWTQTGFLRHHHLAEMLGEEDEFDDKSMQDISRSVESAPEAPYIDKTENWLNLGLKRALLEAARGGHDKLAWTTGDMQADRYSAGSEEEQEKRRAGMTYFYDKMLPKALLKLARQHDPEAEFSSSTVRHPEEHYESEEGENDSFIPDIETSLPALKITPKMRESILKKGFAAHADGGRVEGYDNGGSVDPERIREYLKRIHSPLSNNPASVQKALQIAQSYRTHTSGPMKLQTGTGGYYGINQPMDVADVVSTVKDIPGVKPKKTQAKSWEDLFKEGKGGTLVSLGGDRSNLGRLTHINGKELAWHVDLHAGPKYMLEANKGQVWANSKEHTSAFNKIINEAAERGPVFGVYKPMGPQSVDSAHNMFDAVMAQIPDSDISKEDARQFDEDLLSGKHFKGVEPEKAAAKAAKAMAGWPGILNAKKASEFARNLPGTHRSAIISYMDKTPMLKKGFPAIGVTRAAITDPDVKNAQGNMIGHRIARLSTDASGEEPSFDHSTYTDPTHGEYWGDVPLVQTHYAMPQAVEQMIAQPTKAGQVIHPYSEEAKGRDSARGLFNFYKRQEPINQRMLDSVMTGMENQEKYGFKKGGKVRSALMIAKGLKKR